MKHSIKHFIDGEFVESKSEERFDILTPTTNQVIGHAASGQAEDIAAAVATAKKAFDGGAWSHMPVLDRAKKIRHIGDLILKHAEEIAELEIEDTGIPRRQITKGAIPRAAENFYFFADQLKSLSGKSYVIDDT